MRNWKFKYFEKNIKESHSYVFKSLEIKHYIQKFLKDYKLVLHSYQLNFSNSTIHVFVSVHKQRLNKKKNEKKKTKKKTFFIRKLLRKLEKKKTLRNNETNKHLETGTLDIRYKNEYKLITLYVKKKSHLIKKSFILKCNDIKNDKLNNFTEKLIEGLSLFTKNKFNIILTLQNMNLMVNYNQNKESFKNAKLKLQRFEKSDFFYLGTYILITFVTQNNSEKLLTDFISKELRTTKRHNFFLYFIKEGLTLMLDQKFSKILGIKIIIKGRLNNVMRSTSKKITIGKISLIQPNSKLISSETTAYGRNGTLGVKIWVLKKENTEALVNHC